MAAKKKRFKDRAATEILIAVMKELGISRSNTDINTASRVVADRLSISIPPNIGKSIRRVVAEAIAQRRPAFAAHLAQSEIKDRQQEVLRKERRKQKRLAKQQRRPTSIRDNRTFDQVRRETAPAEDSITAFYASWEWSRLRYDFVKGKQRRCECCGSTPEDGVRIVVDHIKPIRHNWALRFTKTNLQLLCDPCNMGKGSRDETDWRPTSTLIPFPGRKTAND